VSDVGSNFSVGQRQLLCLARAILSRNKVLILDEATRSVTRRTDQLLQEALHKSFKNGTISAVAHRLDTIIGFDYNCLVLGNGKVLDFGNPAQPNRSNGPFASIVADTGDAMSKELKQRAFGKSGTSHRAVALPAPKQTARLMLETKARGITTYSRRTKRHSGKSCLPRLIGRTLIAIRRSRAINHKGSFNRTIHRRINTTGR
jgi:ABC-type multidrug transport system ATPase subunit